MDIQQSTPITTVSTDLKATLANVSERIGTLPENLFADVEAQGLEPAGPMIFDYRGVDGNPDTEFDLTIALPVQLPSSNEYNGKYATRTLPAIDYVERVYKGPVSRISESAYGPFYADLGKTSMTLTGELREIYRHWVDVDSEENETAIQVGVKR